MIESFLLTFLVFLGVATLVVFGGIVLAVVSTFSGQSIRRIAALMFLVAFPIAWFCVHFGLSTQ